MPLSLNNQLPPHNRTHHTNIVVVVHFPMTITCASLLIYKYYRYLSVVVVVIREQAWLEEKKEVLSAVTERVVMLRDENEKLSEHR